MKKRMARAGALAGFLLTACVDAPREDLTLARVPRATMVAAPNCPDSREFESLILAHRERYPHMNATDALKLLHHATMGSEHAITDTTSVTLWMEREWSSMGDGPSEPLVDTLGRSGQYARVHLRSLRDAGGDPTRLIKAFIATGYSATGDTSVLACALASLVSLSARGSVPWSTDSLRSAIQAWSKRGYPAVSHSAVFRNSYSPAYRVVARRLLSEAVGKPD
jgi:hypothetical protein